MRLELQETLWRVWRSGEEMDVAAAAVGMDRKTVFNRIVEAGGIQPRRRQTRARLCFADRVHIEIGLKQGRSIRAIASDLDRAPSTISREVRGHLDAQGRYRAKTAHAIAFTDARRPQLSKIEHNPGLRARIMADLTGEE